MNIFSKFNFLKICFFMLFFFLFELTLAWSKPTPPKKSQKVPSPPVVRLPNTNLSRLKITSQIVKPPSKKAPLKLKKRYRPPTRGGNAPRAFLNLHHNVKSPNPRTHNIHLTKHHVVKVKLKYKPHSNHLRLVVYRRKWALKRWTRRWIGHIIIYKKNIYYQAPSYQNKKLLQHEVKLAIQTKSSKQTSPTKQFNVQNPAFGWLLRHYLEQKKGYEIEIQSPQKPPRQK